MLTKWDAFTQELELHFGPSSFENHQQDLFKLRQTHSVTKFQKSFETLCNRVTGFFQTAIRDCFIYGLGFEIQSYMLEIIEGLIFILITLETVLL